MENQILLPFISSLERGLKQKSGLIQVILGPRQVGKTTTVLDWLEKKRKDQHIYATADSVLNADRDWLQALWQRARKSQKLLVVDEVQKCSDWSSTVKALWDEDKRLKQRIDCVLLGSSSLQIQAGLTESLTGRFQLIPVFHWNSDESLRGYGLGFEDFLHYGGYPGSYPMIKNKTWTEYVSTSILNTVIEKDILQYHSVRSPALFRQAFEILMAYPAMEVSYTKLLGQIQDRGNVELVKNYVRLYEGAFLLRALQKFSPSQVRVKSSSPKILPMAPCLYYLTVRDRYSTEERGRAFEAVVGAQLVRAGCELYYWRDGQDEVDYVVRHGRKIFAIEVKSGRRKRTAGLSAFLQRFPTARAVYIGVDEYLEFEQSPLRFLGIDDGQD